MGRAARGSATVDPGHRTGVAMQIRVGVRSPRRRPVEFAPEDARKPPAKPAACCATRQRVGVGRTPPRRCAKTAGSRAFRGRRAWKGQVHGGRPQADAARYERSSAAAPGTGPAPGKSGPGGRRPARAQPWMAQRGLRSEERAEHPRPEEAAAAQATEAERRGPPTTRNKQRCRRPPERSGGRARLAADVRAEPENCRAMDGEAASRRVTGATDAPLPRLARSRERMRRPGRAPRPLRGGIATRQRMRRPKRRAQLLAIDRRPLPWGYVSSATGGGRRGFLSSPEQRRPAISGRRAQTSAIAIDSCRGCRCMVRSERGGERKSCRPCGGGKASGGRGTPACAQNLPQKRRFAARASPAYVALWIGQNAC